MRLYDPTIGEYTDMTPQRSVASRVSSLTPQRSIVSRKGEVGESLESGSDEFIYYQGSPVSNPFQALPKPPLATTTNIWGMNIAGINVWVLLAIVIVAYVIANR